MKSSLWLFLLTAMVSLSTGAFSGELKSEKTKQAQVCRMASMVNSEKSSKVDEAKPCKLEPGGETKGVCKHCGCRMRFDSKDSEKLCTSCKCGVKNKECLLSKH